MKIPWQVCLVSILNFLNAAAYAGGAFLALTQGSGYGRGAFGPLLTACISLGAACLYGYVGGALLQRNKTLRNGYWFLALFNALLVLVASGLEMIALFSALAVGIFQMFLFFLLTMESCDSFFDPPWDSEEQEVFY